MHPPAGGLVGLASVTVRVFAASYLLNTYGFNVSQVRLGALLRPPEVCFLPFSVAAFASSGIFSNCVNV